MSLISANNHLPTSNPASAPSSLAEIHTRIEVLSLSCTLGPPRLERPRGRVNPGPSAHLSGFVWTGGGFNEKNSKRKVVRQLQKAKNWTSFQWVPLIVDPWKMFVAVHHTASRWRCRREEGTGVQVCRQVGEQGVPS